jgi:hypothetical protein
LDKEIEADRSTINKDRGKLNKKKKATIRCFGAPHEKEGKLGW